MENSINDILVEDFQDAVSELVMRNRSILDILTKFQASCAKVNRSVVKSATHCGCLEISAKKQNFPEDGDIKSNAKRLDSHIKGKLCKDCMQTIEEEIGCTLFYLAAICNTLDISLYDVILEEKKRLETLGSFSLR